MIDLIKSLTDKDENKAYLKTKEIASIKDISSLLELID